MSKNKYFIKGNYTELYTTKGLKFIVDTEKLNLVLRYTWCFSKTGYLVANIKNKVVKLHIYLYGKLDNKVYDHINGDKADNRECNLRICAQFENLRNTAKSKCNLVGHLGISLTAEGKFRARIMFNGREINLGHYQNLPDAINARIEGEKKYFKDFAPCLHRKDYGAAL